MFRRLERTLGPFGGLGSRKLPRGSAQEMPLGGCFPDSRFVEQWVMQWPVSCSCQKA
jgi:hypothetical protein